MMDILIAVTTLTALTNQELKSVSYPEFTMIVGVYDEHWEVSRHIIHITGTSEETKQNFAQIGQ